jgi:hydrogenase nickel incorporation protein HypB
VGGVVEIETALLGKNQHLAEHNRAWLAERGIAALNLMSSPGSGKT